MGSEQETVWRILLVDDSKVSRRGATELLRALDTPCEIECCSSAEEVLARYDELSGFDCAIIDRVLPQMDGLALVRELRQRGCELPVIILTGTGSERVAAEALACGVDGYIIKESSQQQLRMLPLVVKRTIGGHRERQARQAAEERLRWREQELTTIMAATPAVMAVLDQTGRYLDVFSGNPELLPACADGLVGREIDEVLGPESVQVRRVLADVRRCQCPRSLEYRSDRAGGSYWLSAKVVPLPSLGVWRALWVEHDITERRRGEQALRDAREQLESVAAHERSLREQAATEVSYSMHEGLAQVIAAATMHLSVLRQRLQAGFPEGLEALDRALDSLQVASKQAVGISHGLRVPLLDALGLPAALEWKLAQVCDPGRLAPTLLRDADWPSLDADAATHVFRLVEAWLDLHVDANTHGECVMRLELDDDHPTVRVQLRGGGMRQAPEVETATAAMTARARQAGGVATFEERTTTEGAERVLRLVLPTEPVERAEADTSAAALGTH